MLTGFSIINLLFPLAMLAMLILLALDIPMYIHNHNLKFKRILVKFRRVKYMAINARNNPSNWRDLCFGVLVNALFGFMNATDYLQITIYILLSITTFFGIIKANEALSKK